MDAAIVYGLSAAKCLVIKEMDLAAGEWRDSGSAKRPKRKQKQKLLARNPSVSAMCNPWHLDLDHVGETVE